jgi:signal transduction histidine kinase
MRDGATVREWSELSEWVGFSPEDEALLRAFWIVVAPRVDEVMARFYARVLANPETHRIAGDDARIASLKCTLARWLEELLVGPHDDAYAAGRRRVGLRHVQVGLEARYMHAGMQVLGDDLLGLCLAHLPDPMPTWRAVNKVLALDLALMTGSFVDSRERLSVEALQDLLVTHLRTVVILADESGLVVAATRSTSSWLGGVPLVGRPWDVVLPAGLVAAADLRRTVSAALASGQPSALARVDVREAGDRQLRSFRVDVVPVHHHLATLLLEVEELTEVVGLEGRLGRSEALAQLGALSAAVAHELRNPLAGISGAIQVISRTIPKDAPYAPVMVKVEREIRRLDALVTDLLAFARPGVVRLGTIDLREPVQAAVDWTGEDHPRMAIEVVGRGEAQADPDLVQQIVLNLLQNAAQAMASDPGCQDPRVRVSIGPGRIEVSDVGPGVPEELGERIFEPFTTTKTRGTGLGLAICLRSAVAMGGTLAWRRREGRGATFVLSLNVG